MITRGLTVNRRKMQPLWLVIEMLVRRMRKEFPKAKPFSDGQSWDFDPQDVIDGMWSITIIANTGEDLKPKGVPRGEVSIRVINAPGPPRMFLTGWDEESRLERVISVPVFYDEVSK